jgi:hypothetical protein
LFSFSDWCTRANESSSILLVVTIGAVLAALGVALSVGVDHLTTLTAWSSPLVRFLGVATGTITALLATRDYYAPRPEGALTRSGQFRRDRFGLWVLRGFVWVGAAAAASVWLCAWILGIAAQYSEGPHEAFSATVVSIRPRGGAKVVCSSHLDLRRDSDGSPLSICLATLFRPSLATGPLNPDMRVTVVVKKTRLGVVVLSVEPNG